MNKLQILPIVFLLVQTALQAQVLSQEFPMLNAYSKQYKGKRSFSENHKLLKSKCLIKANSYIYGNNRKEVIITTGNANVLKNQKKSVAKKADYFNAVKSLSKCYDETNNPIVAWQSLYIIKAYTGLTYKQNVSSYKTFSKALYEDKSCDGYINYGDIYAKGISTKPQPEKALKIYKQGLELCKDTWHQVILQMRIQNIKK